MVSGGVRMEGACKVKDLWGLRGGAGGGVRGLGLVATVIPVNNCKNS